MSEIAQNGVGPLVVEGRYVGPIVDAHHHVWDLERNRYPWLEPGAMVPHRYGDYSSIKRTYLAEDFLRDIEGQGVVATVYMEAEWDPSDPEGETAYIESVHAATGVPGAMVAQAWLDADDVGEVLARQAASPLVRSVRHKPGGPGSRAAVAAGQRSLMSDPKWRAGYALLAEHGLHFDLQTPWWNLPEARSLVEAHPETTLVINHSGVILDRAPETMTAWTTALREIAEAPNVVIKASGLCVEGSPWTVDLNREAILTMVDVFGPDRVMFGSNFPVDGMFVDYPTMLDTYREVLKGLPEAAQSAVFHDTARRVYAPVPIGQ